MTDPDTISADYTLRPSELAATLKVLVEARQPVMVWGPPGCAKSEVAQQVAAEGGRTYCDVRALLLDPVDLRGIPWRDGDNRTRWAPPDFLPPTDSSDLWLVNLEELPSGVPMVQAALFQLVRDRKCGEYQLPEGASIMACGNRESDRGVVHRMPAPLASRFVHLEIKVDPSDWCEWGAANGIAPETLFFIQLRPELLHQFDPQSREAAFACPRTWEFVSNVVSQRGGLDPRAAGGDRAHRQRRDEGAHLRRVGQGRPRGARADEGRRARARHTARRCWARASRWCRARCSAPARSSIWSQATWRT